MSMVPPRRRIDGYPGVVAPSMVFGGDPTRWRQCRECGGCLPHIPCGCATELVLPRPTPRELIPEEAGAYLQMLDLDLRLAATERSYAEHNAQAWRCRRVWLDPPSVFAGAMLDWWEALVDGAWVPVRGPLGMPARRWTPAA